MMKKVIVLIADRDDPKHGEIAILSGLSIDEVRTPLPVRPGDVLTVEARWDGLRRSRSKTDRGIAGLRCTVRNQRGETVMEYGYRYLVACRPKPFPRK